MCARRQTTWKRSPFKSITFEYINCKQKNENNFRTIKCYFYFSPSVMVKITKTGRVVFMLECFRARRAPTAFGTHKIITSCHTLISITSLIKMFTRMKTLSRGYMLQFPKKFHIYIFLDFTVPNWLMTLSKLIFSKLSLSILRFAKLLRHFCPIEAHKYDRISFSFLKDSSQLAIDTSTVRRIWRNA